MNGFLAVTTNYFRFVLTFSFFTSKQLLFLPICFTVCAIIAKNIGLSDFEINYKADVPGEMHVTVDRSDRNPSQPDDVEKVRRSHL